MIGTQYKMKRNETNKPETGIKSFLFCLSVTEEKKCFLKYGIISKI